MDQETRATTEKPALPPDEVLRQVERIVASNTFRGSDIMRRLLLFLANRTAVQPGAAVKEYELAMEVLHRASDYDPRVDSTARVVASRLRSKLAEYYQHEGTGDPIIIDIPRGAYVLTSAHRASVVHAGVPGIEPATEGRRITSRRLFLAGLIGASAAAGPAFLLGRWYTRSKVPEPLAVFWADFTASFSPPVVVYSNPRFVGAPESGMRLSDSSADAHSTLGVYTGTGEVVAVRELTELFLLFGKPARVKRALLFTWDEAQANDLIFVGGQVQNLPLAQWPRLQKFNFKTRGEEPNPELVAVRNEIPVASEQPFYFPSPGAGKRDRVRDCGPHAGCRDRAAGADPRRDKHLWNPGGRGICL